ncbi:Nramp family divalent metal transporter [Corynebacterium pyruviciproducens]|uniref:Nramp family divalent metal transporter n=1 Tax=Corynebacterium pyruviciproducens TaxID=598660 RepID=A0AAF1BYJ6_9CORY|nr:Nramp family divalent metal transporter [Corynebacterium pyruviciproducens]WOT01700.1 Nramp family divalent metal transporter [Corynebacterium pyruviciproducens]
MKLMRRVSLLGPAFVAAVAYVDPGNVAANITAGARYGFLLIWVLVLANAMAVVVQYHSAKLGIVTGQSLPALLGDTMPKFPRLLYWAQAEIVAAATDIAEVVGGAIALNLLFDLPLVWGAIITGFISLILLAVQGRGRQHVFERVVIGLLLIIAVGFLAGLFFDPPNPVDVASGLVPRFQGPDTVILAASMLGATVMPHAIYLHSTLVVDRFGEKKHSKDELIHSTKIDVVGALILAGLVNIGLLVVAANSLFGVEGTDSIEGAHQAIVDNLGSGIGLIFAIGLLASGLASTSVGAYAGSEIMRGLLHINVPILVRRLVTLVPAIIIIALGANPTMSLVWSQVLLSVGIPFAVIPLFWATGSKKVMGKYAAGPKTNAMNIGISVIVIALNLALVVVGA